MRVIVFGASGGSGRAAVEALLEEGHEVTAFVRGSPGTVAMHDRVRLAKGDVLRAEDVMRAVEGHDAVVVALGIRESALAVRLRGPVATASDVRSVGTKHVIAAMRAHGVRRLVVQTTFGVGESRERLPFAWRCIFALLLAPQIADTELQEVVVRESGLAWVLVQPVGLHDGAPKAPRLSVEGETVSMSVSRRSVGRALAAAVTRPELVHRSVAVSE